MSTDDFDGLVPFADGRFSREDLVEVQAPHDLDALLEQEIRKAAIEVPSDDFMEIRCESANFATAVFMVRRAETGKLNMLVPAAAVRKPS